jgi:3-oxoacyl-[acyl-carrier protein] reductase
MRKTIVITGASKGIGAETARLLAPGNTLFLNYASSDADAARTVRDVEQNGGTAILAKADIASEAGCVSLFEQVQGQTGSIDVLINNAGSLFKRQAAHELDWNFMIETFSLNAFAAMKLCSLFVPLLRQSKSDPNIVNLTTVGIRRGAPTASIYGASKGALDAFTRAIAVELAPAIRVNAVSPGVVVTPFHDKISTPQHFENWKNATPLKRNGAPLDIAKAIQFVVNCDFLCGETIDVNGGQYMR